MSQPALMTQKDKLFQQGIYHQQKKNYAKAKKIYQKILSNHPDEEPALANLAVVCHKVGDLKLAKKLIDKAIAIDSKNPDYYFLQGSILHRGRSYTAALSAFQHANEQRPSHAETLFRIGLCHKQLGQATKAFSYFQRAFYLHNSADYACEAGSVLLDNSDFLGAKAWFQDALAIDKKLNKVYPLLLTAMFKLYLQGHQSQKFDELEHHLNVSLKKAGLLEIQLIMKWYISSYCLIWDDIDTLAKRVTQLIDKKPWSVEPWQALGLLNHCEQQQYHATHYAAQLLTDCSPQEKHPQGKPIKIGYVSSDFRCHPTSDLVKGVLQQHDRKLFEVIAFSTRNAPEDVMQEEVRSIVDKFIDISESSDSEAADRIKTEKVDILVDLNGYTDGARPEIFAKRPVPIQVSWLAYPGTMGAKFMDYMVVDEITVPSHLETFYTESLIKLPQTYMATNNQQAISQEPLSKQQYDLPNDAFVFCAFNASYKIEPKVFSLWMNILKQVPNSVLWLYTSNQLAKENMWKHAEKQGISADRVIVTSREIKAKHLARHRLADLFLDTLDVNAHTSAIDALWAGLPVLTCPGETFASRACASYLNAVGMPELIMNSYEDYQAKAIEVATTPSLAKALKNKLAEQKESSPLFNTQHFTRQLERAYQTIWDKYQRDEAPSTVSLT